MTFQPETNMDLEKIADDARWERNQDESEEREIRQQLDELRLDGTYDHYIGEFFSLSDDDIERLAGWYECGDLCTPLADAWCKAAATIETLDCAELELRKEAASGPGAE